MKSFPPVFNIRFASFIKSSTRSAIRAKQKTTASTAFVSRGVLRTSQAVTRSLCFTRSNEWTLNLRSIFRAFSEEKKMRTSRVLVKISVFCKLMVVAGLPIRVFGFSDFRVGLGKTRVGSEFGRASRNFSLGNLGNLGHSGTRISSGKPERSGNFGRSEFRK